MKKVKVVLSIFVALFLVTGCESMSNNDERIVVYDSRLDEVTQYSNVATAVSSENIQVFSLDSPAVPQPVYSNQGAGISSVSQPVANVYETSRGQYSHPPIRGASALNEPNVVVFPLQDGSYENIEVERDIPPMMPPAGYRPTYQSPFPQGNAPVSLTPTNNAKQPVQNPFERRGPILPQTDDLSYRAPSTSGPVFTRGSERSERPARALSGTERIYFAHNSVSLDQSDRAIIKRVGNGYRPTESSLLRVEGHASARAETNDPIQRQAINLAVSMKRAVNVSQSLIAKGVPANAIQTVAYGDTRPGVVEPGLSAEAASRRVEITPISVTVN